jgi:hypothetical protein
MKSMLAVLMFGAALEGAEQYFVVRLNSPEFRYVVTRSGARDLQHPDLRPDEVLVAADERHIEILQNEPAVSHLYPASPDLISAAPVYACATTMEDMNIGEFKLLGKGWGAVRLTYTFESITPKLGRERFVEAVQRAMAEWSKWVRLEFVQGSRTDGKGNLNFLFASGAHGDRYVFDGPRKTLAHTFYPADVNPEPIAGDLHFDEDENWQSGVDPDFYSVVLHELGHALGIGHSDQPNAVMYPYYRKFEGLQADDVKAVRNLYPAKYEDAQPQVQQTPPASPVPSTSTDKSAPALRISYPATPVMSTASATARVSGTASDNVGVTSVTWTASGGRSGVANGTTTWTIPDLALRPGDNSIVIRAYDQAGNSSWRSLTIARR